jgi:2-aminoethylphosphonate-pyruvate transaminase
MSSLRLDERADNKLLFTPGPLTTSLAVKRAMLHDLGSRDSAFLALVSTIRRRLLAVAGADPNVYVAVPMQGSGTYGVEATIGTALPPDGRLLVLCNGAYGRRIAQIAAVLRLAHTTLTFPEHAPVDVAAVDEALRADPAITHVIAVHCETTSGLLNPIPAIGALALAGGKGLIVDAMSSFGAVPLDLGAAGVDFLISSANKCIEGVPGFAFVIARRAALESTAGYARSLSLNLLAQWRELEQSGQFRFTPPTHALLAFHQALLELEAEGGPMGRAARYRANSEVLVAGMHELGFREYLAPEHQGYIITAFHYPTHPAFEFQRFYQGLNDRGFVIYPGKLSDAPCFRIGTIGRLFPADIQALLAAVCEVIAEMGVDAPGCIRS